MNKKFKSLKKKILVLILNIILFIGIVACFVMIFQFNTKSANHIMLNLNILGKDILKLRTAEQNFLLNFKSVSDLYISNDTQFENEFSLIQNNIITIVDSLSNSGLLQNDPQINDQIQILSENLKYYADNFQELVLIFKEKGSGIIGVTGEWQDISARMINKYSANTDNRVYTQLLLLKNTERKYLLNRNPGLIDELSGLSDDIQNLIIMALDENIELPDITDELYKYLEKAKQISNLDKRTGFHYNTGIIQDLNDSFQELGLSVSGISLIINNLIVSSRKKLCITLISILVLLLAGLIFMISRSFKKYIYAPLAKISNYFLELKTGKLPDEKIELKENNEFHALMESVNIMVDNCKEKMHYTQNINKGSLDSKLNILSADDLLGKELVQLHKNIQDSVEEHKKHNEENDRRRFINEGLAKFSDILRLYNNDIEKLADIFIKELVKYLDAIQGGLFLVKDSDAKEKTLQLISAFAFNRKKYINKEIKVGEGLVGACAIEKNTINLTDIPKEYISITSGLGDAPPNNLLLLPIIQEDEILGVLEIASLKKFLAHEIEIGEQVTASLASTVTTTKNNEKTSQLLAKSQAQAQEMLEQEEEMRQNMEELKATQEEATRREEEYKGIINAMDRSSFMVEYDLDGNIIRANEKLLLLLGKTREELMGKKHASLSSQGSKSKVNAKFWDELKNSTYKVITEKIQVGKNKEYTMMQNFSTVYNNDGILVKFLNMMVDISSSMKK